MKPPSGSGTTSFRPIVGATAHLIHVNAGGVALRQPKTSIDSLLQEYVECELSSFFATQHRAS
jgi:hypothetical protein